MDERCVVPTLPHEVIIADMVYPVILLAHGWSIALLPAMAACMQSGLWVLTKSFYQVEALVDKDDNPLMDQNGKPQLKRSILESSCHTHT